jgi:hypothetical protein
MARCSVLVTIGGIFDGDENASFDVFSTYINIEPGMNLDLGMMCLVFVGGIVGVVVLMIILFGRRRTSPEEYRWDRDL